MAEWFRKNIIIIVLNAIITIVLSIIGVSVKRVVASLDDKPSRVEVNIQFETAKAERNTLEVKINAVEKASDEKLEMILDQFKELRKDLRLKQTKN